MRLGLPMCLRRKRSLVKERMCDESVRTALAQPWEERAPIHEGAVIVAEAVQRRRIPVIGKWGPVENIVVL